jgi:signal transduction histidine kinase
VIAALRTGRTLDTREDSATPTTLQQGWAALDGVVDALVARDPRGAVRVSMDRAAGAPSLGADPSSATLPVRMPVYDPATGERIGRLEARVRLSALLPAGLSWSSGGGSVLALFDEAGGAPLLPLSMGAELFASDRFDWAGDQWIVVQRQLQEPRLRFAIAAPLAPVTEPFSRAARRGALALVVVLVAGLGLSALLTRRITGPLQRLAIAADEVAGGRFEQRVSEGGPDELRRLGHAFNTMTESLSGTLQKLSQREAVAAVGEFAASLAHEVRNPLTAIRLDLERARERLDEPGRSEELLGRALAEIDRLESTVTGALRIARSGSLTLSKIDLRQPLRAAMDAATPVFSKRHACLQRWEAPAEPLLVHGNASALEQLFLNLLLNAAEALPPGGRAYATVEETKASVRVLVRDEGPGIAADMLERIREPFFTTKEDGTGLGLSIGQRIARAHGAELVLESTPGAGTAASVVLARE